MDTVTVTVTLAAAGDRHHDDVIDIDHDPDGRRALCVWPSEVDSIDDDGARAIALDPIALCWLDQIASPQTQDT